MVELQLLLEIIDKASANLSGVRQELIQLDKAADSAENGLDQIDDGLKKTGGSAQSFGARLKETWAGVTTGINSAISIFRQVADVAVAAFEAINEGAQLGLAQDQFATLADNIGTTSEAMITGLRAAAQEAATDAELIQASTTLLGMGAIRTEQELLRVVDAVGRLKKPTDDLSGALDNFGLLLANRSVQRLDSFKISSAAVTQRLEAMGISSKNVATDSQFLEAVLAEADVSMRRLGVATTGTTTAIDKLKTMAGNEADVLKQGVAQGFTPMIAAALSLASAHDTGATAQERADASTRQLIGSSQVLMGLYTAAVGLLARRAEGEHETQRAAAQAAQAWADEAEMAQAALEVIPGYMPVVVDALRDHEQAITDSADANLTFLTTMEDMYAGWEHQTVSLGVASAAWQAYRDRIQETTDYMRGYFETAVQAETPTFDLTGAVFDLADKFGLTVGQTAALTGALLEYSPEAINAGLQSAYLAGALEAIVRAFQAGELSAYDAQLAYQTFVDNANALDFAPMSVELAALKGRVDAISGEHKIIFTVEQRGRMPQPDETGPQGPKDETGNSGAGQRRPTPTPTTPPTPGEGGSYALGGWTGAGGGYVHPYELVIPQETIASGPAAMLAFADRNVPGGVVGAGSGYGASVAPQYGGGAGGVTFIFQIDASGSLMSADVWSTIAREVTERALAQAGLRAESGARGY